MDVGCSIPLHQSRRVADGISEQLSSISLEGDEDQRNIEESEKSLNRSFEPKPQFFYYDDADGVVCNIILPAKAPIHQIIGAPQLSTDPSKKDACLKACKKLHDVGALTDYLLPHQDDKYDETTQDLSVSDSCDHQNSRAELHEMLVPAALRGPWRKVGNSTYFSSYYIKFSPKQVDRMYRKFGLFVKEPLPQEAGNMQLDLCLARGRMVTTKFIPSGVAIFNEDEVASAEKFQKMFLDITLDLFKFIPEYFSLEENDVYEANTSTFYLLLPIVLHDDDKISVDWMLVNKYLSSPTFRHRDNIVDDEIPQPHSHLHLSNGGKDVHDIVNSLVYVPCKDTFFFISDICHEKNGYSLYDESKTHVEHYIEVFNIHLAHPDQPLLKAKQPFVLDNLLRKKKHSEEWREKEEHFIELPPEICQLKMIGFSNDIGSSLALLPSILRRLESFLVAMELREKLFASLFPEAAEVTADRILEGPTTERCGEHFSLERFELLGDASLKFAVGRHLFLEHDALDEGQLTRKRFNIVDNYNLLKLATSNNLQFSPLRDLQELCQYHKWDMQFSSVKKDGKFSVDAKVDAKKVMATACATNVSGKMAKKIAARQVFECLKAQGYRTKKKSLEEVLGKCEKREAKLIGYDETSSLESVKFGKLKTQESPRSDCDVKLYPPSEASTSKYDIVLRPLRQTSYKHTASESHVTQTIHNNGCNVESPASHLNNESELDSQGTGSICSGTAKSCLYEKFVANCWKPPIFECCSEIGPSHFKQFIYKIVLDIEEMPEETFEFYGEPRTRKTDAAENAAQGAIWFLKCQGYLWDRTRNKGN